MKFIASSNLFQSVNLVRNCEILLCNPHNKFKSYKCWLARVLKRLLCDYILVPRTAIFLASANDRDP